MQPGQHRRAGPRLARAGRTLLDKIVDPGAAGQEAIGVPAFPPHSLEMADPPSPPAPLGLGANGRAGCVDGARRVFGSLKMGVRERERENAGCSGSSLSLERRGASLELGEERVEERRGEERERGLGWGSALSSFKSL